MDPAEQAVQHQPVTMTDATEPQTTMRPTCLAPTLPSGLHRKTHKTDLLENAAIGSVTNTPNVRQRIAQGLDDTPAMPPTSDDPVRNARVRARPTPASQRRELEEPGIENSHDQEGDTTNAARANSSIASRARGETPTPNQPRKSATSNRRKIHPASTNNTTKSIGRFVKYPLRSTSNPSQAT